MSYSLAYHPYTTNLFLNRTSINPATQLFITAAGITNSTQINAIDDLIVGLQTSGLWNRMKAVYPFVTDNRNVLSYSEDFNNAYWSKDSSTIGNNATIAPNGTLTADLFTSTAAFGRFRTNSSPRSQVATYTFSCYIKGVPGVASVGSVVVGVGVGFTITSSGTITVNAPIGISSAQNLQIENVGNGWYRVSGTRTYTSSTDDFQIWSSNSGDSFYVWGAQLEISPAATTYQPILITQQAYISNQFKYNLVDPVDSDAAFRLVFNGGWTHSSLGATPNGTNAFADTKLSPLTVFTADDDVSFGYYTRDVIGAASHVGEIGSGNSDLTNGTFLISIFTGNNISYSRVSADLTHQIGVSATPGLYYVSRRDSGQYKVFKNGVIISTATIATTGRTTNNMYIGGMNYGSFAEYGVGQCAFSYISDGLTDTEATNLYTLIQAYQTALNRQV